MSVKRVSAEEERIRFKYRNAGINMAIPEWHKEILDKRLEAIKINPDLILPIEKLFDKLNK